MSKAVLEDLIQRYGEDKISGLLLGTHTIIKLKKPANKWQDFLVPLQVGGDPWHVADMKITQRGCIYRAAHALDYDLRVQQAHMVLGRGAKGIVITRLS